MSGSLCPLCDLEVASLGTWVVQPSLVAHFLSLFPREFCVLSNDSSCVLRSPIKTDFPVLSFLTDRSNFCSSSFLAFGQMYAYVIVMPWVRMVIYCITLLVNFSSTLYLIMGGSPWLLPHTLCLVCSRHGLMCSNVILVSY